MFTAEEQMGHTPRGWPLLATVGDAPRRQSSWVLTGPPFGVDPFCRSTLCLCLIAFLLDIPVPLHSKPSVAGPVVGPPDREILQFWFAVNSHDGHKHHETTSNRS